MTPEQIKAATVEAYADKYYDRSTIEWAKLKTDFMEGYLAGYKARSEGAGVWVKAKDRLPDKEGEYYVKYTTGEKEVLYASGVNHKSRWLALVDEWLDESPVPAIQEGEKPILDQTADILKRWKEFYDDLVKALNGTLPVPPNSNQSIKQ